MPYVMSKFQHIEYAPHEKIPFDMHKYTRYLNEWNEFVEGKEAGCFKAPFSNGIQSRMPQRSAYTSVKSDKYWQSIAKPSDMYKRIDAYFNDPCCLKDDMLIDDAFDAVKHEVSMAFDKPVRPYGWHKTFKSIPQDTSPGYPLNRMGFTQKRMCGGLRQRFNVMMKQFTSHWSIDTFPCMAGVRNQICAKETNKPRLTWVYPMEVTMIEATFALPLFKKLKRCSLLAWDIEWHNGGLPRMCNKMPLRNAYFGTDVSHFDASCLESRIRRAFSLLRSFLDLQSKQEKNAWKFVVNYFVNTWIVMYDNAYLTDHGVPSGSYFTQIIDSLLNAAAVFDSVNHLAKFRGFVRSNSQNVKFSTLCRYWNFLGDDSIIELLFDVYSTDLAVISKIMFERHNFEVHPDKGFFSPTGANYEDSPLPEFLGYTIASSQDLLIDEDRLKAQMSLPENPDKGPEDCAVRLIGLGYSHGTSWRCHRMLSREYKYLVSEYEIDRLVWNKGSVRDYLVHVLGMTRLPTTFPTYKEVSNRFRGSPTLLGVSILGG